MTAILNVKEGSAYAHLNGKTFDVIERNLTRVTLLIGDSKVDFLIGEVIMSKLTKYEWFFNWGNQVGGSLGSFEASLLKTYQLASVANQHKLATAFTDYFMDRIYIDTPSGF